MYFLPHVFKTHMKSTREWNRIKGNMGGFVNTQLYTGWEE